MSAAQGNPIGPIRQPASLGPQLVPSRETAPAKAPLQAIESADPHPLIGAFIIVGIAATGAITFVGSILIWMLVSNTGVNWMFQNF